MTLETIITFSLATFIFAVVPGPGILATTAKSMSHGFASDVILVCGILIGDICYLSFALLGLAAIAESLGYFFIIVRYMGAAYILFLGIMLWLAETKKDDSKGNKNQRKILSEFTSGLFISLGNPKVILFYLGFLPVFWDLTNLTLPQGVIIVTIVISILSIVFISFAFLASKGRELFKGKRKKRFINRSAGTLMILAGIKIAQE